jgi:DNA-binding SARP family transcriptional activator
MDTRWRIELLAGLRAARGQGAGGGDRSITRFRTHKTGALLAYLAYYLDRAHPRDVLIELLWPECEPAAGRNNLSRELSALRDQLEPPAVFLADRARVQLNPEAVVTDVAEFEVTLEAAARAQSHAERSHFLLQAVELYRGELLPGYYDDWVLRERERLAEAYSRAIRQLVADLEQSGEIDRALPYARRAVSADPLREEAHRDLMRLLAAAGQPAAALRQFRELERLLRQELDAAPEAASTELAREIERRSHPASTKPSGPRSVRNLPAQRQELPAAVPAPVPREPAAASRQRIALLHQRGAQPEEQLLRLLERELAVAGYAVFTDRGTASGVDWATEIERQVRTADAVIPLLSPASVGSEILADELQIARDAALRQGRPRLLAVRIHDADPLPEPLGSLFGPTAVMRWEGPEDDERLVAELCRALRDPDASPLPIAPPAAVAPRVRHEPVGGALPVGSPFYVVRRTDGEFAAAIGSQDSIVLVKAARQTGKTSLLARGLQQAREAGARVVLTDFQKLNAADLHSAESFFLALAEAIADQLQLEILPDELWNPRRGPNTNFERYLRQEVLGRVAAPIVWGLDEVDRLFTCDFGSEVFGLFRAWHNERSLDPSGPWERLTLAMAYATEAHLFIADLNQSPFNVGTRLTLEDFTLEQVADLNVRHGSPLRGEAEVARLDRLLGGHPYLVQRALYEMAKRGVGIADLEAEADRDEGIFGDHLRRILVLLARDPELSEVLRGLLRGLPCPTVESFYRLRSAGVVTGDSARDARPRCRLYQLYLDRHLR